MCVLGALQGGEWLAETGSFPLTWVSAGEKAAWGVAGDGGGEGEQAPFHQEPNIWVQGSGGGWR